MARDEWDNIQKKFYTQDIAPQTPEFVNKFYAVVGATNTNPENRERILMTIVKRCLTQYSSIQDTYNNTAKTQGRAIALGDLEFAIGFYFRKHSSVQ